MPSHEMRRWMTTSSSATPHRVRAKTAEQWVRHSFPSRSESTTGWTCWTTSSRRTVPKKWMNAEAFDMDAIKNEPNVPGSIGPFQPQPGLTVESQYIMVEPTPTHQPALPDFIKWFITTLSEEISGALPSLFGNATGEKTVGNAVIQRDQALQRVGCPWNSIQDMFALGSPSGEVRGRVPRRKRNHPEPRTGAWKRHSQHGESAWWQCSLLCGEQPSIPRVLATKSIQIMDLVKSNSCSREPSVCAVDIQARAI